MCDLLQSINWERFMSEGNMLYPLLLGLPDEIVEGEVFASILTRVRNVGVGIGESPTIEELQILLNLRAWSARWCVLIEATP